MERRRTRLNDLPDTLVCQILSYLSTKDSVRTTVLSKRWRSLWLQVPALDLNSSDFENEYDFAELLNRFLQQYPQLDLNRFDLVYDYQDLSDEDNSGFQWWINAVIKRRVCRLDVQIKADDEMLVWISPSLFSCKTLVYLSLFRVVLESPAPESVVSLSSVKIMHLERVRYDGDMVLEGLITSCPVLEELSIIRDPIDFLEVVCVRSKSLKCFILETEGFEARSERPVKDHAVEIDAPRLNYMSLHDHVSRNFFIRSIGPSPEVDIDVNFDVESGYSLDLDDSSLRTMIHNFLIRISTVRGMKISADTLEVIDDYSELEPLPQFSNLSWLHASFRDSSSELLPTFLDCCPTLRSLVVKCDSLTESNPSQLSNVPLCFTSSLQFVRLKTPVKGTANHVELAKCFLRNCSLLKELRLSGSFGNIIKKIRKISKPRGCKIVIG